MEDCFATRCCMDSDFTCYKETEHKVQHEETDEFACASACQCANALQWSRFWAYASLNEASNRVRLESPARRLAPTACTVRTLRDACASFG
eukprot:1857668-Pleurochrysis_carterae.AAC.2